MANKFYTIEDGVAHVYVEIPKNPVFKKYTVYYEDGAISRNVSLALVEISEDIGDVKKRFLNGLVREVRYKQ